ILIKSLEGILPHSILRRQKQGFSIPLGTWLRGPLRDLLLTHLSTRKLRNIGLFDLQTIETLVNDHNRGAKNYENQLWAILTFVIWHDLYIRGVKPAIAVS